MIALDMIIKWDRLIVIGFVCGLLGLLHYLELKPDFISKTGLIGLICGAIGFIFSFVYVILNGIVFTNNYDDEFIKRLNDTGNTTWSKYIQHRKSITEKTKETISLK